MMDVRKMEPEDREYFIACVEAATLFPDDGRDVDWVGWVEHFDLADKLGKSRRWSETRFRKFDRWGWFCERNNCDAYLTKDGLEAYNQLRRGG